MVVVKASVAWQRIGWDRPTGPRSPCTEAGGALQLEEVRVTRRGALTALQPGIDLSEEGDKDRQGGLKVRRDLAADNSGTRNGQLLVGTRTSRYGRSASCRLSVRTNHSASLRGERVPRVERPRAGGSARVCGRAREPRRGERHVLAFAASPSRRHVPTARTESARTDRSTHPMRPKKDRRDHRSPRAQAGSQPP